MCGRAVEALHIPVLRQSNNVTTTLRTPRNTDEPCVLRGPKAYKFMVCARFVEQQHTSWHCRVYQCQDPGQKIRYQQSAPIEAKNLAPNPTMPNKHPSLTRAFRKVGANFCFFPVTRVRNPMEFVQKKKTCSDKLFYFGWIFSDGLSFCDPSFSGQSFV